MYDICSYIFKIDFYTEICYHNIDTTLLSDFFKIHINYRRYIGFLIAQAKAILAKIGNGGFKN